MTKTWRKRKKQQLAYGAARRAAWVAQGLRCDGKPRAAVKPCGCHHGSCLKCATTHNALVKKPALIAKMYADYQAGYSFGAIAQKYKHDRRGISSLFLRRGLPIRHPKATPRLGWGVKIPFPSKEELAAIIAKLKRLSVPPEIKVHWRKWSLAKRRMFIKTHLRKKFPSKRPTGKFSSNVQPFEYGTPRAHAIADHMNRDRISRNRLVDLNPRSEGVIYHGRLYFWDGLDSYVQGSAWADRNGPRRPILKQIIYRQFIGSMPPSTTVIQKDGNKNNFSPSNLALRTRAECALQNAPHRLPLKRREEIWDRSARSHRATGAKRSRAETALLLQSFQQPNQRPVMAELLRTK